MCGDDRLGRLGDTMHGHRATLRRLFVYVLCLVWAVYPTLAQAQLAIGNAQRVVNLVSGTVAEERRDISVDDPVFQNEGIETGSESAARLLFQDQSALSVGANSRVTLDEFVYDPARGAGDMVISLSVGVFRFVSGKMPKGDVVIRTPTALIGIRGTIIEIIVLPDGTTIVRVLEGVVTVTALNQIVTITQGAQTSVPPGQPPAPPTDLTPTPTPVNTMNVLLAQVAPGVPAGEQAAAISGGLDVGVIVAASVVAAVITGIVVRVVVAEDSTDGPSITTAPATTP